MARLRRSVRRLRFVSYLAPSLPEDLFEVVAEHVGKSTGTETSVQFHRGVSAPPEEEVDPFTADEADIGFLCPPGYVRLSDLVPPPVRLLPAALVFDDPRAHGRPVYFSDVIVRRDAEITCFDDLRGRTWAFNDPCSLSGYLSLVRRTGDRAEFFSDLRRSGSHLESVRLVACGEVAGAAIDSIALALLLRREPELRRQITVLEALGPHPVQPIVVSSRLPTDLVDRIAQALRTMHQDPFGLARLRSFGILKFAQVSDDDYTSERAALKAWRSEKTGEA